MPHPDDASEPDIQEFPCLDCQAKGCVKCEFIGYRAMTAEEKKQYIADMRNPERS